MTTLERKPQKRWKHLVAKVSLIVLLEMALLFLINLLAIWFGYKPHTVLVYILSGSLLALVTSMMYDKKLKPQYSPLELEVMVIKWLIYRKIGMPPEEFNAEVSILDKALNGNKSQDYEDFIRNQETRNEEMEEEFEEKGITSQTKHRNDDDNT